MGAWRLSAPWRNSLINSKKYSITKNRADERFGYHIQAPRLQNEGGEAVISSRHCPRSKNF
jgi:hypothetical protein